VIGLARALVARPELRDAMRARMLCVLAAAEELVGEIEAAHAHAVRALELARRSGEAVLQARTECFVAARDTRRGSLEAGEASFARAMALAPEDSEVQMKAHLGLGYLDRMASQIWVARPLQ
jgi:ATP/maltotriose-dependent transcriptional regulator MalT